MALSRIEHGHGRVVLRSDGSGNVFSKLSATYPLKLLSPQLSIRDISIVYMLSYGGGLVGGDHIQLDVEVHDGARLAILSQGSTKVFKARPGKRLSALSLIQAVTKQCINAHIAPRSAVFLLPDPVTCFRSARYHQIQTFHLSKDSSAVLLDWITSGRKSLGEEWVFSRYYSVNELWLDGRCIAKDSMLLEERDSTASPLSPRSLAESLAPYSCYATLIIYGDVVQDTIRHLAAAYSEITVFKQHAPPSLLWSMSLISDAKGSIIRVAATETEDVKNWLRNALRDLEEVLGVDVYRRVFA